jgi:hypothetical protein
MNKEQRQADLLAKAKEADEQAKKSKDLEVRASWEKIAQSYRDLAKRT